MSYQPDFEVVLRYLPNLASGLLLSVEISAAAFAIALVAGLFIALASLSTSRPLALVGIGLLEVFRGIPEIVLLIWVYFVLPIVLGVPIGGIPAGIIGLGLLCSAYVAEIYRAGLRSVPRGNVEAARSLGMSRWQTLRRVQLPQAALVLIPGMMNNYILLLKGTSLLLALAVPELMFTAYRLGSISFRPLELLTAVALLYLAVTSSLSFFVRRVERSLLQRVT
jgi:polar amino acid transport system permease protein